MIVRAIQCNNQTQTFCSIQSIEDLNAVKKDPNSLFWLDLQSPTDEDLQKIAVAFDLHPLAIEDATSEHQRPKVDQYENFFFVVFYAVQLNPGQQEPTISEVDMFLGTNYLITVHQGTLPELDELEQRWTRKAPQLEWNIGILLYSLLDTIVDHYFPVVDALVDQAEALEDRMFISSRHQDTVTLDILELKKRFLALRRIAAPERDVLNILTNRDNPIFDKHVLIYFRDIYDHLTRLAETIDLYRDQMSTTMDAHLSLVSNDLNQVMRTLTVASIILMADSLIAGIYGMNFENMPELHLPYAYFACLALMALLSLLLGFFFKRLGWF
ncbi:MAG TPA: magnesium/cobalt transporter CorA [Ktedonosporobacter sp.]|nr:magnesium/cobalt transporter CorA [Ktedonosporobacter sp.]